MTNKKTLKKISPYEMGALAFKADLHVDDNPYNTNPEALQWEMGFLEEEAIWRMKLEKDMEKM